MTALDPTPPAFDPARAAGHIDPPKRVGFFTDTSICIGCKACEVACKEWNAIPEDGLDLLGMSYDNTGALGGSTWRHVAFIEQAKPMGNQRTALPEAPVGPEHSTVAQVIVADGLAQVDAGALGDESQPVADRAGAAVDLGMPGMQLPGAAGGTRNEVRWLMASDVCKHCTHAACLDVCPTGSLFRTEYGTVVVQEDICNGCGYCVSACPYGVIDQRRGPDGTKNAGLAQKCTLCYDRLGDGLEPACSTACPTKSIQFGELDELRERAAARVDALHEAGLHDARLYGHDPHDGVGGDAAFFLLLDEPEVYGLPPDPVVTTKDVVSMWKHAGIAALALAAGAVAAFSSSS